MSKACPRTLSHVSSNTEKTILEIKRDEITENKEHEEGVEDSVYLNSQFASDKLGTLCIAELLPHSALRANLTNSAIFGKQIIRLFYKGCLPGWLSLSLPEITTVKSRCLRAPSPELLVCSSSLLSTSREYYILLVGFSKLVTFSFRKTFLWLKQYFRNEQI